MSEKAPLGLESNFDGSQPEEKNNGFDVKKTLKGAVHAAMLAGALSNVPAAEASSLEPQNPSGTVAAETVSTARESVKDKMEFVNGYMLGTARENFAELGSMPEGEQRLGKAVDLVGFLSRVMSEFQVDNQDYHHADSAFNFGDAKDLPPMYHEKFLKLVTEIRDMYQTCVDKYGVDYDKEPQIVLKLADFDRAISALQGAIDSQK